MIGSSKGRVEACASPGVRRFRNLIPPRRPFALKGASEIMLVNVLMRELVTGVPGGQRGMDAICSGGREAR